MVKDCLEMADNLSTHLNDSGYPKEIVQKADELAKQIEEYQKENPENVPTIRMAKTKDDYEESEKVEEESEESESENEKDVRDMDLKEHKSMLKKKNIIISLE